MAIEKRWEAIAPRSFTADGTSEGVVTLASTLDFHVKQLVIIKASGEDDLVKLEVKRVDSATVLRVGPVGNINARTDISAYTTAASATIEAEEQARSTIPDKEYKRAVFEEEPVVAIRTIGVDRQGNPFGPGNPLSVQLTDGSVNIGTVNAELEVQLSHQDNVPDAGDVADSVQIGDGVETVNVNASNELQTRDDDANTTLSAIEVDTTAIIAAVESIDSKLVDGNDIGDVTINNTGANRVPINTDTFTPEHVNGNVTTAGTPQTLVPTSTDPIKTVYVECNSTKHPTDSNGQNDAILFSIDGGTTYTSLLAGESVFLPGEFTDLRLDTNSDGTFFSVILWS